MRKQISAEVSAHWEGDGLVAVQDDRNGNLIVMSYEEAEDLANFLAELIARRDEN